MKTRILSFTMGCLCLSGAWAQITLVEGVNPTITFDTLPTMAQGWSTIPMAGATGNLTTQAQMDAYVNTVSAASAVALVAASANPPGITGNGGYDPATQRLYTRPTSVNAASLLARVVNTVGADLNRLTIAFDLLNPIAAAEEIPPYAVYYSFTGAANSWTSVPQLSGSTVGTHSFELNFPSAWTAGATLYILWVDDNASPSPDALFELDNVVFTVPTGGVVAQNAVANPGFESVWDWGGWFPFGPATISTQTNQVHSGSYAALVENRSATWMGIAQEVRGELWPNLPYVVSAWVRLAGGPNQTMELVMKQIDESGTTYTPIASSSVSANGWTRISGLYTLHLSGGLPTLYFYVQMPSSPDAAYYIDDVEIKPILPPVIEANSTTSSGPHFIFSSTLNVGGVVAADLDEDGRLELISASGESLTVLARGSDGSFTNSTTVAIEGAPASIAVGDVNGDGKLDVVTSFDFSHRLTVLTNRGNGTLILATNVYTGERPLSVKVADVNRDGRLDLISANHGDGTLTVLTNDGLGGFSGSVTLMARGLFVVADFNGDGAPDLIATDPSFVGLTMFTNSGNGNFAESSPIILRGPLGYLAAADLNGDGNPDVITVLDSGTSDGGSLAIMTNRGNGTFALAGTPSSHWLPASMAIADVNEDGWQDLVGFDGFGLKVLLNNGKGRFYVSTVVSVAYSPVSVVVADVVGDAKPDLIFVNFGANSLTILRSVPPSPATTPHSYVFSIGDGLSPSLQGPRGVAVDGTGNLYVSDTGNNRIVKFSNTGEVLAAWGNAGSGTGEFSGPFGIAIDRSNNVFVADQGNGRIQKFNRNGVYLTQWGTFDPRAVAIDGTDHVYVSRLGVQKFTSSGTLLQEWPIDTTPFFGISPYAFSSSGLAVGRDGSMYLGIAYFDRDPVCCWAGSVSGAGIEKLGSTGSYVNAWGGFGNVAPDGLAVDGSGVIYVANRLNKQILKYTSEGIPLTQWELPGGRADPVSDPRGVAVDSRADVVYVADAGNNRILVFARQPSLSIHGGPNSAVLSWSTAAIGYRLQTTTNLAPPVTWVDVTHAPTLIGGQFTITNTAPGAHIFRLVKP